MMVAFSASSTTDSSADSPQQFQEWGFAKKKKKSLFYSYFHLVWQKMRRQNCNLGDGWLFAVMLFAGPRATASKIIIVVVLSREYATEI